MVQEHLRVLILQSNFFICYAFGNIHLMIETVLCVIMSIQRLQMRQICRNISSSSVYLIRLENSQQSAHKVLLNNKYYYL